MSKNNGGANTGFEQDCKSTGNEFHKISKRIWSVGASGLGPMPPQRGAICVHLR